MNPAVGCTWHDCAECECDERTAAGRSHEGCRGCRGRKGPHELTEDDIARERSTRAFEEGW